MFSSYTYFSFRFIYALTITFEIYSNIDLKAKALLHFMKSFKILNLQTKILFSLEKTKKLKLQYTDLKISLYIQVHMTV